MKIRHERPMSNLSFQVRAPLGLELSTGDVLNVTSWSLNGIQFPDDMDLLPTKGILSIPFQGVDIRFPVRFKPGSADNELFFDELTGRQRETLAVFYRSILSGRMASTEDIITSLDTPVDLVPMEETEEELTEGSKGKTPRFLRVVWNLTAYAIVGAIVFTLLGQQIWSRISVITVGQARIIAEIIDHRASSGAYVDRLLVAEGDTVNRGETLATLSSPDHKRALIEIRSKIRRAESDVSRARRALAVHMEGLKDARHAFVVALNTAIAERRLTDFFGNYSLENVRAALRALTLFDEGASQKEGDFHDRRIFLNGILRQRKDELSRLKRELSAEKSEGGAADIVALENGTVTAIPVFEDQFLARGDIAIILEAEGPRHAVGWLDESMAAAVYPGMDATMTGNSGGEARRMRGEVVDVTAMPNPDRAGEFGLRVIVLPAAWAFRDAPELVRPDAPLNLTLERSTPWLSALRGLFHARP